jgi:DNA-binding beta-propeller fold protein YncE
MMKPNWIGLAAAASCSLLSAQTLSFERVDTYTTGIFNQGAAEIVAYDSTSRRLFIVNAAARGVEVLDISRPVSRGRTMVLTIPEGFGRSPNSVAVHNGIVAVAVEAAVKTDPGYALFFDSQGSFLSGVPVGAQPDMITFTPDGTKVLTANEGEPNDAYTVDPEGSVSVIDISRGVRQLTTADATIVHFREFNNQQLPSSIRVYGPRATVAQDLEPEYIAVSSDSRTAYVTLQENNAIAVLDIATKRFTRLMGLGFKDHSRPGAGIDASDRDDRINIANWPVFGMYQPDAIAVFESGGQRYLITANEGDGRGWTGFNEEERVGALNLDPSVFPNAAQLQRPENIGRLTVTKATGDSDGDGDFDFLYALGGRSFSIWKDDGTLVFDSGDALERLIAERFPTNFNSDAVGGFDTRSDNKGPEPEGLTTAEIDGRRYAFIALERMNGIVIYDITDPVAPKFVEYVHNQIFTGSAQAGTGGDHGPENVIFISAEDSPTGKPLMVTANEVSGSTTIYNVTLRRSLEARIVPSAVTTVSREIAVDGSSSTGDIVSYEWRVVGRSAAIISRDPLGRRISVQFAQGFGTYILELTVRDATGMSSTTRADLFYAGQ